MSVSATPICGVVFETYKSSPSGAGRNPVYT
jgi:hypothetical protein